MLKFISGLMSMGKLTLVTVRMIRLIRKVVVLDEVKSKWSKYDINVKSINGDLTRQEYKYIVDSVNYVYEFFDRVLYFDMYKTVPVNILVLRDKKEYVNYLRKNDRANLTASYGVYFPKENQIVVYIRKDREGTFRTIKHEVSHAIVDTSMPFAPAWLNEGLAEQMETLNRSDEGLYVEAHKANGASVHRALRNKTLTKITDFLKLPSNKWRHTLSDGKKNLQEQAGQFVYFLLSSTPCRSFVIRLMHDYKRGSRNLSYYLVNEHYVGGINTLELTWRNWLNKNTKDSIEFF